MGPTSWLGPWLLDACRARLLGMQLRLVRPDGTYDVGSDAFVGLWSMRSGIP